MLDRIRQNDYSQSEAVSQRSGIEKVDNKNMSNPYSKVDRGLFIDESNISADALNMYSKEQDIKKFTELTLSDSDDLSADQMVLQKVFDGDISIDNEDALYSILNNENFLKDIEF